MVNPELPLLWPTFHEPLPGITVEVLQTSL
jgi:hypothetical protein